MVDREKIRRQILAATDEQFDAIAAAVDERRGVMETPTDFTDKLARALSRMSEADLVEWMQKGARRGDAAVMGRIFDALDRLQRQRASGDVRFEIVPYEIQDRSVAEIIQRGPDVLYPEWEKAMFRRATQRGWDAFVKRVRDWEKQNAKQNTEAGPVHGRVRKEDADEETGSQMSAEGSSYGVPSG